MSESTPDYIADSIKQAKEIAYDKKKKLTAQQRLIVFEVVLEHLIPITASELEPHRSRTERS